MPVQTQILTRRGAAATWTSTNPTLGAGEIGFESDTNKFKIGTGSTAWVSLPYASNVSPLTTKGDLYTYSTDNDRLAVGANGETLVADSSTSTGLRYTAGTVQANPVLNSAFQIWQRGTSISVTTNTLVYTADRWLANPAGLNLATTVSRQTTGDTTNLPNIQYCLRYQRNSGQTGTAPNYFAQTFETINSIPYAGKVVTFSFYARAGANYSPTSSNLQTQLQAGTSTDAQFVTGTTNVVNLQTTLTTTWQRFTYTSTTIPTNTTQLGILFTYNPTGTAGANDYFEVTGVQIDVGSVALPFRTNGATIQGELAACQRYYYRTVAGTAVRYAVGYNNSTSNAEIVMPFPVRMRIAPTALEQSGTAGDYGLIYGGIGALCTSVPSFVTAGNSQINFNFTVLAGSLTVGQASIAYSVNSNGYLGWSAEL
jgi:hypothetical protein